MKIVALGNEKARQDWPVSNNQFKIIWIETLQQFSLHRADVFVDLDFEMNQERIAILKSLSGLVVINSVAFSLEKIQAPFIRINAWAGFFKNEIIECASVEEEIKQNASTFFTALNKKPEWLPDTVGFITPRIVAMIINEAYYAVGDGVSTKEEIDIAMKLGTNYPYGPFEWAGLVGINNIVVLLNSLAETHPKYLPAPALKKEAKI